MKRLLILFFTFLVTLNAKAQLEDVIVEKYYVADSLDAADTTYGVLEKGAITYRIYIDLKSGYKLLGLFGNQDHAFKISSSTPFYNHLEGKTFGYDINKGTLTQNTMAIDSWLTLGQITLKKAKSYGGILKAYDTDGSFIGGTHNDDGLLGNEDPQAGIPLTKADGYAQIANVPAGWLSLGIEDTSIFGAKGKKEFISNDMVFSNKGITGVIADSNQILIAQLTTKGKLAFELNIDVLTPSNKIISYVASGKDSVKSDSSYVVKVSSQLSYPKSCGCMDPHYLEYNKSYACQEAGACKTLIICGCTDPMACNYDSNANVNIPALCCYPGSCNNRDISVVCPTLNNSVEMDIFPNPAENVLNIQISGNKEDHVIKYTIYDAYGVIKLERSIQNFTGTSLQQIDLSAFTAGLYWVRLSVGGTVKSKMFIKK
jgi:hypothetical protein